MLKNKLQKKFLLSFFIILIIAVLSGYLNAAAVNDKQALIIPDVPKGLGYEANIPVPDVYYPLPVQTNYVNQTGTDVNGTKINKYDPGFNPIIKLLSGFESIWTLGNAEWSSGGANGNGPDDYYSKIEILDKGIWADNMKYVLKVTGKSRTDEDALNAYLDDRRYKHYSVIDGLGPLAEWYKKGAGATTTINHTLDTFDVNKVIEYQEDDAGTGPGVVDSQLGNFVAFMQIMRGPEGTTSPSKYYYSSPRPWRMNDKGEVIETGRETIGDKTFESYESNVQVVPALKYVRETRGPRKDGAYPSGHTNAGYLSALAYAYAIPERFSEMLTRASDLGENRIIAGMHSPLDVIGGRIMSTAIAAAYLNDPKFAAAKKAAYDNVHEYFASLLPEGETLVSYAQTGINEDRWANDYLNKSLYLQYMTYGFKQDVKKADQAMIVPLGAEVLLETRLPYLSAAQRRVVLYTTGIDSGYPLLDKTNGWGRLNLVAAADGYGEFYGDVIVTMNASLGGFNALDSWDNNISGKGMLNKNGTGTLVLTGNNKYSGGTIVNDGTLVGASFTAFGINDVYMNNGRIVIDVSRMLYIKNNYTQINGTLQLNIKKNDKGKLKVSRTATIAAGVLHVTFDGYVPKTGETIELISAKKIHGRFTDVIVDGFTVTPLYSSSTLKIRIDE